MKFHKVLVSKVDPKVQAAWDHYARTGQNKPSGSGPNPTIKVTNNPDGSYGGWTPSKKTR